MKISSATGFAGGSEMGYSQDHPTNCADESNFNAMQLGSRSSLGENWSFKMYDKRQGGSVCIPASNSQITPKVDTDANLKGSYFSPNVKQSSQLTRHESNLSFYLARDSARPESNSGEDQAYSSLCKESINKNRQGMKSSTLNRQVGQEQLNINTCMPIKPGSFMGSSSRSFKRSQVRVLKSQKSAVPYRTDLQSMSVALGQDKTLMMSATAAGIVGTSKHSATVKRTQDLETGDESRRETIISPTSNINLD